MSKCQAAIFGICGKNRLRRGFYGTAWCDQVPRRAMGRGVGLGLANQIKQTNIGTGHQESSG